MVTQPTTTSTTSASRRASRRSAYLAHLSTALATVLSTLVLAALVLWLGRDGWLAQHYGPEAVDGGSSGHVHSGAAAPEGPIQVMVTETQRLLANIGTEPVRARRAASTLRTVGRVVLDETRLSTQTAWVDGRLERLYVRETGERVEKGQRIASIYSPELLSAQEVFLSARASSSRAAGPLVEQTRRKLELLGMSRPAITRLERTGQADPLVTIHATSSGTVTQRMVEQGQSVMTGEVLFELADLSRVWVEAEVYERDRHLVSIGTAAAIRAQGSSAALGHNSAATVTFVHPYLDEARHTVRVRLEVDNAGLVLRPNQYVDVLLEVPRGEQQLVVPTSAVVRTGGVPRVWVEVQPGVFQARLVTLGALLADGLVVTDGLRAGDAVVVTGTFLVDSQATLEQPAAMDLLAAGRHPFHRPGGLVAQPGALVGDRTICPVMHNEFTVTAKSPVVEHHGQPIYFCCAGCNETFLEDPEGYLARAQEARRP